MRYSDPRFLNAFIPFLMMIGVVVMVRMADGKEMAGALCLVVVVFAAAIIKGTETCHD